MSALLIVTLPSWAQQVISVSPFQSASYGDVAFEAPLTAAPADLTMDFKIKCFAPNLRSVPGPLAPDAEVTMELGIHPANNTTDLIQVVVNDRRAGANPAPSGNFKGWHFKPFYWTSTNVINPAVRASTRNFNLTAPAGSGLSGSAHLNKDHLRIFIRGSGRPAVSATGAVSLDEAAQYAVKYIRLKQEGAPNQNYVGSDGPLNASVKYKTSSNGSAIVGTIDVPAAARPGQIASYLGGGSYDEFCGGWFSPLMVFFDEKRPLFQGESNLLGSQTYWPEKGSPGYFIAWDRNKNGLIDQVDELFGDATAKDGFAALKELDSNADGLLDDKDTHFKELLLWNGHNQSKKEIKKSTLQKHGIKAIRLTPEAITRGFGDRAESRGESTFDFQKGSEKRVGKVQDIYFKGR